MLTVDLQRQKGDFCRSLRRSKDKELRGEMILISPPPPIDVKKSECHDGKQKSSSKTHSEQEQASIGDNEADTTTLAPGQCLQDTALKIRTLKGMVRFQSGRQDDGLWASFETFDGSHPMLPSISLTSLDVNRWKMAWRAFQLCNEDDMFHLNHMRLFLQERYENWPDFYEVLYETPRALGFIAAALIYGGLHALAWFAHFDSFTEQILWRISACVVLGGLPLILILVKSAILLIRERPSLWELLNWHANRSQRLVFYMLLAAYARAYLVVECFMNLSHLPAGVYDVPNWAAYFPHISRGYSLQNPCKKNEHTFGST